MQIQQLKAIGVPEPTKPTKPTKRKKEQDKHAIKQKKKQPKQLTGIANRVLTWMNDHTTSDCGLDLQFFSFLILEEIKELNDDPCELQQVLDELLEAKHLIMAATLYWPAVPNGQYKLHSLKDRCDLVLELMNSKDSQTSKFMEFDEVLSILQTQQKQRWTPYSPKKATRMYLQQLIQNEKLIQIEDFYICVEEYNKWKPMAQKAIQVIDQMDSEFHLYELLIRLGVRLNHTMDELWPFVFQHIPAYLTFPDPIKELQQDITKLLDLQVLSDTEKHKKTDRLHLSFAYRRYLGNRYGSVDAMPGYSVPRLADIQDNLETLVKSRPLGIQIFDPFNLFVLRRQPDKFIEFKNECFRHVSSTSTTLLDIICTVKPDCIGSLVAPQESSTVDSSSSSSSSTVDSSSSSSSSTVDSSSSSSSSTVDSSSSSSSSSDAPNTTQGSLTDSSLTLPTEAHFDQEERIVWGVLVHHKEFLQPIKDPVSQTQIHNWIRERRNRMSKPTLEAILTTFICYGWVQNFKEYKQGNRRGIMKYCFTKQIVDYLNN
jgi:hypothetical protein